MAENRRPASLKKSSDFLNLKKNGRKLKPAKWLTIYMLESDLDQVLYGIIASRKIGASVVRNKLKRWVRELAREWQKKPRTPKIQIVFSFHAQSGDFFKNLKHEDFIKAVGYDKVF